MCGLSVVIREVIVLFSLLCVVCGLLCGEICHEFVVLCCVLCCVLVCVCCGLLSAIVLYVVCVC